MTTDHKRMTITGEDDGSDSCFFYIFYGKGLIDFEGTIDQYNHTDYGMEHRKNYMLVYDYEYKSRICHMMKRESYLMLDYSYTMLT